MEEKMQHRVVSNLNLADIGILVEKYPNSFKEVRKGFKKAADLLGYIIENEYSKEIRNLANIQIERFIKNSKAYKILQELGLDCLVVGKGTYYPAKNPL
jgi:hypothetical protein